MDEQNPHGMQEVNGSRPLSSTILDLIPQAFAGFLFSHFTG